MRTPFLRTAALLVSLFVPSLGPQAAPATPIAAAAKDARSAPPGRSVLPWIEDDLTRAMTEAKARKLPVFIESWAPW